MGKILLSAAILFIVQNAMPQNVGIGTTAPRFPLSFGPAAGAKISLYDDGNPALVHFGLSVQSGQLLQIHSATLFDDIAFGFGGNTSFTERMRIKGNGKVGINTASPLAYLHVADSNVLFTGPHPFVNYNPSSGPPVSGPGTRQMWYAQKGAFRAGWVEDNRWDKDSMGTFSMGLGHSVLAYNVGSLATGVRTSSYGFAATAMGYASEAVADYSFAAGYQSRATGQIATAIGSGNLASGLFSTAIGNNSRAAGTSAVALGESNTASGSESAAVGSGLKVKARSAFAAGWLNDTADSPDPVFSANTDRIFQIGNGNGFLAARSNALTVLRNGHHGLGTVTPLARLHVADSSVLFTGPASLPGSPGPPPVQGPGTRMMWYPQKAAFRAGYIFGSQWNMDSIGVFSVALGNSNVAMSEGSFAMGSLTAARGQGSVAMGVRAEANGGASTALGIDTKANGERSFATGDQSAASGYQSTAMGYLSTASGDRSLATGYATTASGFNSTAIGFGASATGNYAVSIGSNTRAAGGVSLSMGEQTRAVGNYSTAMGYYTRSRSEYSFVTGRFNDTLATNRIFEIGNGTADNARKNAVTILQSGYTGINTAQPAAMLHVADSSVVFSAVGGALASPGNPPVTGQGRRMMWYADKGAFRSGFVNNTQWDRDNTGDYSVATGFDSRAAALGSVAMGVGAAATGTACISMGWATTAGANYSVAMGLQSLTSGNYSFAMGFTASAQANTAVAMGDNVTSKSHSGVVIGRFNDVGDAPNAGLPQPGDRVFQIGNGADNTSRSNAITVLRNGNMGIGNLNPLRPISFPPALGEKILLYPGGAGEVGIGVYNNELRIHCDNPGSTVSFGTQDNAGVFTQAGRFQISGGYALFVNGSIWANGTTYASDERFKQNITAIQSPLEKLLQINGVEYEMKAAAFPKNHFPNQRQMGLLAQNVEKVVPDAVHEQDGYKGVDYAKLVPLLIESIKEQQRQIEALQSKIKLLENK